MLYGDTKSRQKQKDGNAGLVKNIGCTTNSHILVQKHTTSCYYKEPDSGERLAKGEHRVVARCSAADRTQL
eukprot:3666706-Amphidinium_carterae.1